MKFENPNKWQFCDFEYSKRLKELGVEQKSLWWWRVYIKTGEATLTSDDYCKSNPDDYEHYSAFNVAELGEMLPEIYCSFRSLEWYCQDRPYDSKHSEYAYTEANARAKMLIYLFETQGRIRMKGGKKMAEEKADKRLVLGEVFLNVYKTAEDIARMLGDCRDKEEKKEVSKSPISYLFELGEDIEATLKYIQEEVRRLR